MPISLRTRPTCHYCGKRNSPVNNQQKFKCQYCEAENYLDESGQVADVPASTTTTPKQYAVPVTNVSVGEEASIFCSTCLKNQYMYNTALSEYLPDPDHPEYEQFEAAIPAFKADLERRFPTCCANCEPKVRAQLQRATYNARSDHVRRVLDRSRQRRIANKWGWRSLLVNAAGLGWLASLLTQTLWHAMGSQTYGEVSLPNMRPTDCLTKWPVPAQCPHAFEWLIGPSLLLGVFCIWWNPKWQHKLEGREGRLTGLDQFYKVQGVLLALRFVAWIVVKDIPHIARFRPMMHTISLVLTIMVAVWSRFSIVKIHSPQIVDWSQNPAPLLDSRQFVPPATVNDVSPPYSQEPTPVNIFNTAAARGLQPWRPPTPPVDEDAMEWDPTPVTFSPNLKKLKYKSTEPTPFQGTLPAFPQGGIYQTRKVASIEQPKAIGLPPGFFDKSHGKKMDEHRNTRLENAALAQPKFFPDIGRADTGLENIFDTVFSLQDHTSTVAKSSATSTERSRRLSHGDNLQEPALPTTGLLSNISKVYNVVMAAILATFGILFTGQCYIGLPLLYFITTSNMLRIVTSAPLLDIFMHVVPRASTTPSTVNALKIITSLVESLGVFLLNRVQPEEHSLLVPLWNKLVVASLALLVVQEIYSFCTNERQPPAEVTGGQSEHQEKPALPETAPTLQAVTAPTGFQALRRSSSDESLASTASIATTSTASGWKTPLKNHREELKSGSSSTSYGFGGLSLKNDHTFGSGNIVAEPRTRRTPARGGQRGW